MNVFTFTAGVGADAELRNHNGTPVASIRLAVDTGTKDKPATMWLNGSIWGSRAEKLAPMLKKGTKLFVSGALSEREYTAKDGSKGTSLEVRINEIEFAGPRQEVTAEPAPAAQGWHGPQPALPDSVVRS